MAGSCWINDQMNGTFDAHGCAQATIYDPIWWLALVLVVVFFGVVGALRSRSGRGP